MLSADFSYLAGMYVSFVHHYYVTAVNNSPLFYSVGTGEDRGKRGKKQLRRAFSPSDQELADGQSTYGGYIVYALNEVIYL